MMNLSDLVFGMGKTTSILFEFKYVIGLELTSSLSAIMTSLNLT